MKKSLILFLILGAFSIPHLAFANVTATTTNTIDYIQTNQNTLFGLKGSALNYTEFGWGYRPGASHNICSITIIAIAHGSPIDSVDMSIRSGTTTASGTLLSSQGTLIQSADASYQIRDNVNPHAYTFTFTPCAVVVGASWYDIIISRTGIASSTNYYEVYPNGSGSITTGGTASWVTQRYLGASSVVVKDSPGLGNNSLDIYLYGTENFSANDPSNTSTTTQSIAATCSDPNIFSYSICYLFTPSQSVLSQFSNLSPLVASRIPFSYVNEFNTLIGTITTSTTTAPSFEVNFQASSIGSTSPFGNILPDVKIDNAAIQTFLTPTIYSILMLFQAVFIWSGALLYVYKRAINFKLI